MKQFRQNWGPHLVRPLIYQAFTRFFVMLLLVQLWDHFVNTSLIRLPVSFAYTFAAVFFGVMAWMAWLRMDGLKVPKIDRKLFRFKPKKPVITYGDLPDYIDEEPTSFEELEDIEKDICLLLANVVCCVFFVILSFIF